MSEQDRAVCNLQAVSLVRMLFGHYSELGLSRRQQWIVKFYCAVAPLASIGFLYYFFKDVFSFIHIYRIVEAFIHYFISMYTKSKYVYEYYEFIPAIDGAPWAAKMYSKLEKILLLFTVLLYVEIIFLCCNFNPVFIFAEISLSLTFSCFVLFGRMPLIMIFSLLYCRANIFRKNVIATEGRPTRRDGVNNHVLAYTALNESLDKTGWSPMFLLCIQVCSWFVNNLWLAFEALYSFKSENYEVNYVRLLVLFLIMILDVFFVFYPAIMLELASEEVEQSRIFVADLLVTCTDKAKRGELGELMYFLRHQPLQYRMCHTVPLSARLPLALVMLGTNYLVCAIQFTNTFGNNSTQVNATGTP